MVARGEPAPEQEVLAVRLLEGLVQRCGFFAVAVFEVAELDDVRHVRLKARSEKRCPVLVLLNVPHGVHDSRKARAG